MVNASEYSPRHFVGANRCADKFGVLDDMVSFVSCTVMMPGCVVFVSCFNYSVVFLADDFDVDL